MHRVRRFSLRPTLLAAGTAIGLTIALSACGSGSGSSSGGQGQLVPITIAENPFSGLAAVGLGQVKGIYAHYGFKVNLKPNTDLNVIVAEVQSGQVQLGYSSLAILVNAIKKGVGVRCVAPVENVMEPIKGYPQTAIVVAKNSPIKSVSQLGGGTLGLPTLNGIYYLTAKAAVTNAGGNFSSVKGLLLSFADMTADVHSGKVTAAEEISPFIEKGVASGQVRILDDLSSVNAGLTGQCFFASNSYISSHKALLTKFVMAQDQAILYAKAHPGPANGQIARVSGVPASALKGTLPPTITYSDDLAPPTMLTYEQFMQKWGGLTGSVVPLGNLVWVAPGTPMKTLLFNSAGKYTGS